MSNMNIDTQIWLTQHSSQVFVALFFLASFCVLAAKFGNNAKSPLTFNFAVTMLLFVVAGAVGFKFGLPVFQENVVSHFETQTLRRLVTMPPAKWSTKNDYTEIFKSGDKMMANIRGQEFVCKKQSTGAVFLYDSDGVLRYAVSPNGGVVRK